MPTEGRRGTEFLDQEDTTEGHPFDELARGLADGTISRRQALKLSGAFALGAALMPLFPRTAHALSSRQRRRCRQRGGTVCNPTGVQVCCPRGTTCGTTSTCPCAGVCGGFIRGCEGDSNCACALTTRGSSLCVGNFFCNPARRCDRNADCPSGSVCIVDSCCPTSGAGVCAPRCSSGSATSEAVSAEGGSPSGLGF